MAGIPIIEWSIPQGQLQREIKEQERHIEAGLNRAVDRLLVFTGAEQATSYTASSNPAPPPGTRYVRSFTLARASQIARTSHTLPVISGVWSIDEGQAPYGEYVLGTRAQQARVHRGRWKDQKQVEKMIKELAPLVVAQEIAKK